MLNIRIFVYMQKLFTYFALLLMLFPAFAFTGIEDENGPGIKFYPNPAKDVLHVTLEQPIDDATISIKTIIGGEINLKPEKHSSTSYSFQVDQLNSGYYLLIVESKANDLKNVYKFAKL